MASGTPYDWVLFDQGGTLFEPLPAYYSERNQRAAIVELGHPALAQEVRIASTFARARQATDVVFHSRRSYTHRQLVTEHLLRGFIELALCDAEALRLFTETQALPPALDPVVQRYCDRQQEVVIAQLRLKPGTHKILSTLSNYSRLAIVSNNSEAYLQPLVRRWGLLPWFDSALTSDSLGACKPDPEIFVRAFAKLGIKPTEASRVLYVGDTVEFDVRGARAAGMDVALLVAPSLKREVNLDAPNDATYCVASLSELADLFTALVCRRP